MKFCLLLACILGCITITFSQVTVMPHVPVTVASPLNPSGMGRGTSQMEINYHVYEWQRWQWNPSSFEYYIWRVNKAYTATTNPYNNTDGYCIRWGAVVFDTLRDITHNQGIPYTSVNSLTVDSVVLLYNHVNHSGQANRLILSIYTANAGANKVGYTNGTNMEFSNTLLWRDTITTTTSLTPTGGDIVYRGAWATGGVTVPGQQGYVVRVDYEGPKTDTLSIADGNPVPCGADEGAETAFIVDNTLRYFVGVTPNTPPVFDLSGIDPLYTNTIFGCDLFFFQNLAISTVITADINMTVQASGLTKACAGGRSQLLADVSSTSGRYSVSWSGPGLIDYPDSTQTWATMPATSGNYMYIVTAIDSVTGEIARDTLIKEVSAFRVSLGNDTVIRCQSFINFAPVFSGDTAGKTFTYYLLPNTVVTRINGPGTYRIFARNGTGCVASDTISVGTTTGQALSFTVSSFLNQNLNDTLQFTNGDTLCQGMRIFLRNTSAKKNGWNFKWIFSGTSVTPTSPDTISRILTQAGPYNLVLTADSANCSFVKSYSLYVAPYNESPCFNFSACPAPTTGNMGYAPLANSLPCIEQGVNYQETIHFELPTRVSGNNINTWYIDSITNLPCGITYTLDRNQGYSYAGGETGCIKLSGTTTDSVGKYKMRLYVRYYAGFITWRTGALDSIIGSSYNYDIRVKSAGGSTCANTNALAAKTRSCANEVPLFVTIRRNSPYVICPGNQRYLDANGGGGRSQGNYTYSWSPATSLSCANCKSPQATPTQTTTYTVTATDGHTTAVDTFTLEVANPSNIAVTITNDSSVFCYNKPNTITVAVSGAPANLPYSLTLYVNGQSHSNITEGANTYLSSRFNEGDALNVLLIISNQGCNFVTPSNYLVVSSCFNTNLQLDLNADTLLCARDSSRLSAVASGGTGNYTYRWLPQTGLSCYNCPNPIAAVPYTTIYSCAVFDGQSTISKNTKVMVADVHVDAGPDANTCNGGAQLLATTAPANTVQWSPANGLSCTNCINPIATPTVTTVYYVEATGPASSGGCRDIDSVTVYVPVGTQASVTITAHPDQPCYDPGLIGTITFEAHPVNGENATYQWQLNGNDLPAGMGGNNRIISLPLLHQNQVSCIMRSNFPCVSPTIATSNTLTMNVCVGIAETGGTVLAVKVHPNPSTGIFHIDAKAATNTAAWTIAIFDLSGKKLYGQVVNGPYLNQHIIDLGDMAQGTYLLQVSNGVSQHYERVMIF